MSDKILPAADVELKLERINCPLCGLSDSSVVMTLKDNLCGIPGEFHLERCNACSHQFMNPRPCPESLADCYPQQYGPHQSAPKVTSRATDFELSDEAAGATLNHGRPLYLRILPLRYIPGLKAFYRWLMDDRSQPVPLPPVQVEKPLALELGCATGNYLLRLQEAGWKAMGIEPGERPSSIAKSAGLDVHCGTLEATELQPEQFELAAAWMVIEHVPDAKETLRRLHSLLKPGGTLLFSIPNAGCWEAWFFGRYWYVWELPRHLHHFTPSSIRKLLQECGFTEITIIHQRNLSNVVGSVALSILARWPESRFGRRLLRYPDQPTMATKLFLAPFAHILAWIHQGGRLTISARRRTPENGP